MSVHSRPPTTSAPVDDAPTFDARDLLSGADRVRIVLEDQVYTLRITRAGKLILTK